MPSNALLDIIPTIVTNQMNVALCQQVSEEEIQATVFGLGAHEAPRSNGFKGIFFQKYWELLKNNVVKLDIISSFQYAFVPICQIQDNILVEHEAFHGLKRRNRGNQGAIAIEVDIHKAYDSVNWNFLIVVMRRMGICDHWVDLVYFSIWTVRYVVMINGEPSESFLPTRGIRQDDTILFDRASIKEASNLRDLLEEFGAYLG
ncbi:hypothetical protein GH714_009048 [Hevea brasiliensis]|uniref:Reverse transcriptase domain-containing protein n=1 Tax=Hevea brasiliensis TaxID=3981 RepID=A0A6A6N9B8_HEVBR|nr:hypothetical protein GH714_009048 [Hevea brasiliensis]